MSAVLVPYVPRPVLDWEARAGAGTVREVEATAVFVDLSGFTAMSERLARLGREGAEEVTAVIDATFADLLAAAYAAGGSLLKFGGDALLLLFEGDAHPARACFAAHQMRAELRRRGPVQTPAGRATLRMSVGVHTGTFQLFLVGQRHRELVITGPAASRTAAMEHAAGAGQVLLSPETAAALPSRFRGRTMAGGVLLAGAPPVPLRAPVVVNADGGDLSMFIPEALRTHLADGPADPEHRFAAVAFLHFDGTDELVAGAGPAETSERLDALLGLVQEAAAEHGVCFLGTDVDVDGGKIILVAGVPDAAEDDGDRLLRAVKAIMGAEPPVPVRAGVHAGRLFAGEVGPPYRRTYTIMGDTVNTAARIMAKADAGEVLASPALLAVAGGRYRTEALPPFAAKGKAKPLVAYRVEEVLGAEASLGTDEGPIFGRHELLERVHGLVEAARQGAGAAVELVGEAGMGKSRLVEEVVRSSGMEAAVIRGDRYEEHAAYEPVARLLRSIVGIGPGTDTSRARALLQRRLELLAPQLTDRLDLLCLMLGFDDRAAAAMAELSPAARQAALGGAVAEVLDAAFGGSLLLVVEDGQWLDEGSRLVVEHLGRQAATRPWFVLVARRPDGGAVGGHTIELEPLPDADARRLVRHHASVDLLPSQVAALVERGTGNPLFLLQLAANFVDDRGDDELPESLESMVAARIDGLGPALRSSLRRLSVLGGSFSADSLAVVGVSPAELADLHEFLQRSGGMIRFRQLLFRDVAYSGLPFRRRRQLHETIGRSLLASDGGAEPQRLSFHFSSAGCWPEAWEWSLEAGRRAEARLAFHDAVVFFTRAVGAAKRFSGVAEPEVAGAWRSLGYALRVTGRQRAAVGAYREARRLVADDPAALGRLCFLEAEIRVALGELSAASRWNLKGLRLLEQPANASEEIDRIRLIVNQGQVCLWRGRLSEARQLLLEALDAATAAGDTAGQAHACNWLLVTLMRLRDSEAAAYGERALALYREVGSRRHQAAVLNNLGIHARRHGHWDEAIDRYQEARTVLAALGDTIGEAGVTNNIGELRTDQGRVEEALEALTEAQASFLAAKHLYAGMTTANLARLHARQGAIGKALDLLDEAEATLGSRAPAAMLAEVRLRRAEALTLAGRTDEAAVAAASINEAADPGLRPSILRVLGVVRYQQGDHTAALDLLHQAAAAAADLHVEFEVGYVAAHLAVLGGPGQLEARMQAAQVYARLGVVDPPPVPLPLDVRAPGRGAVSARL